MLSTEIACIHVLNRLATFEYVARVLSVYAYKDIVPFHFTAWAFIRLDTDSLVTNHANAKKIENTGSLKFIGIVCIEL